ncbi:hypothetical protein PanWU01x14_002960 [Parasponia andersonii]|uniref:Uncharacterized protein n=1 Tax=Parasponia andersonii TaxID=3476 RepID=A0A2P5E5H7_PARAD|nr:hypothetical protein PanWU01x14_002960 [Parasponia andersonii]
MEAADTSYRAQETGWGLWWNSGYAYSVTITNKGVKLLYVKIQIYLVVIDFSSNKFDGEIPSCLGNLK